MTWAVSFFYRSLARAGCVYGVPRRVCQGEVEAQVWTVGVSQTEGEHVTESVAGKDRGVCKARELDGGLWGERRRGRAATAGGMSFPWLGITRASVDVDSTLERWSGRGEEALIAMLWSFF